VAQIVYFVFNIYLLGLFVYVVSTYIQHPKSRKIESYLKPYYVPVLDIFRKWIKPLKISNTNIDFTPMILFFVVVGLRKLIIAILVTPF
jgi:uncharacterized protein YggT (Ycf19 family)